MKTHACAALLALACLAATALAEDAPKSAQVVRGDLTKTVFGAGSASSASTPTVFAKTDGTLAALTVGVGDSVREGDVLARLVNEELDAEIAQLEAELAQAQQTVLEYDADAAAQASGENTQTAAGDAQASSADAQASDGDTQTASADAQASGEDSETSAEGTQDADEDADTGTRRLTTEQSVYAPCDGRVVAVYIAPGDDALAVYRERGAVMLLSTDGRMKVELSGLSGGELALGDKVGVEGEGVQTQGTVVNLMRRGMQAVIEVVGDEYPVGAAVTVRLEDGTAIAQGTLEVNKPLAVSAYGGTVRSVYVKPGALVRRRQELARFVWDETPLYLGTASALRQSAKAQASLEAARKKREALTVTAPCDGVVAEVFAAQGDEVVGGAQLLRLVESGAGMTVALKIDELDILRVSPGQAVTLTADALPDETFAGTVERIAPLGETQSGVTTYDVYVRVENLDGRILSGMNVSGEIAVESVQDALLVPTDALSKTADGYAVTLEGGGVRAVDIGLMTDEFAQIVSGLSQGETVVY